MLSRLTTVTSSISKRTMRFRSRVGQSPVLPDLPKIHRQSKDLPSLLVVQDEMV
jgi:hypothetical protein